MRSNIHICYISTTHAILHPHFSSRHLVSFPHSNDNLQKQLKKNSIFPYIYFISLYHLLFYLETRAQTHEALSNPKSPIVGPALYTQTDLQTDCKHQNFSPPFYTKCIKIQPPLNVVYSSYIKCYFVFQVSFAFED